MRGEISSQEAIALEAKDIDEENGLHDFERVSSTLISWGLIPKKEDKYIHSKEQEVITPNYINIFQGIAHDDWYELAEL